jgi:serine/threonine-protein kinase
LSKKISPDSTIGNYRIISKLGAGAMGEVYLASDTRLDRKVALKILPPAFAEDADRMSRFVREAKSASKLNHPNIITIYEIGESLGTHFIATEFIDGKTLCDHAKANRLDYQEILKIAIQVASALQVAHAANIIHRDIKPDNVMIRSDGLAKVLDFGIAKLSMATESGEEAATAIQGTTTPGMIIGTPNYMSPEQARGRGVNHQTDIFSFGVVFYELLSGNLPFKGETVSDVIANLLTKEPQPLEKVSPEILAIVQKSLEKDKLKRYQTAQDLLDDLKKVKEELETQSRLGRNSAPTLKPKTQILKALTAAENETQNSIAVLPFVNMSADDDNEYFCDGLAEELLNALSRIEDLKVAARTSAFSFKGKNANVSEIGEKLSVKNVLEGSVRKAGNRLRISVQLVNASDGFQVWSQRYDREMQDIFELQDEITLSVTEALKVRLLSKDRNVMLKRYTDDPEVYELFLKGRYYYYKYSAEGWRRAIEFFEKAIEKEPTYAPAYAGMNSSWGFLWFLGFLPAEQAVPQMKAATIKALEIDENLGEAHLSQAMVSFFYDWDWQKAEQEFKHAIALDPTNAEALSFYSMFLGFENRFDEAIEQGGRALAIDPLSSLINMNVGWTYFSAGLFEKTLDQVGKMIEVEPEFYGCYWLRGAIYLSEGEYDNAINDLKKAVLLGGRQVVLADLGAAYGLAGRNDEAKAILGQLLEMRQREYVPAICMARIYSRIGEDDQAIDWLEKAFAERNGEMVFLRGEIEGAAQGDALKKIGSNPRVIDLLEKMDLPVPGYLPT